MSYCQGSHCHVAKGSEQGLEPSSAPGSVNHVTTMSWKRTTWSGADVTPRQTMEEGGVFKLQVTFPGGLVAGSVGGSVNLGVGGYVGSTNMGVGGYVNTGVGGYVNTGVGGNVSGGKGGRGGNGGIGGTGGMEN